MKEFFAICGGFVTMIIILAILLAWPINLYFLFADCDFKAPYKAEIIRGIGVIPGTPVAFIILCVDITSPGAIGN
jgi:hypothetical protein